VTPANAPLVVGLVDTPAGRRVTAIVLRCFTITWAGSLVPLGDVPDSFTAPKDDTQWRIDDDLALYKARTDVVVHGSAWAKATGRCRHMVVRVEIPEARASKRIAVFGDRRAIVRGGAVAFTEPLPFERMPIAWHRAYGGVWVATGSATKSGPVDSSVDSHVDLATLLHRPADGGLAYPRNPVGCGWVVGRNVTDGEIVLPNLEDPTHLLAPASLVVGRPADWAARPMPQSFGWVDPGWFPRCVHLGVLPAVQDITSLEELRLGVLTRRSLRQARTLERGAVDFWNGAAAGLATPWLRGGETLDTHGLGPEGRMLVRLPLPPSSTRARLCGRTAEVTWRMHTACADLDARLLAVMWRAELPVPVGRGVSAMDLTEDDLELRLG